MNMVANVSVLMLQLLYQRAAVAGGTIKLDCSMGDVELVRQLMFNPMEQGLSPLITS